jgi:DNA-binding NtrC family response regulator
MTKKLEALVIDDDPQIRRFVSAILQEEGWSISEAATAEEAFEIFHQQKWSLVFCDVQLGGANGYAVLRRFSEEQPQAQFILMTGHGSAAGALDATAFGAYDYLLKPFIADEVLALSRSAREKIKTHQARSRAAHLEPTEEHSADYVSDIDLIGRSPAFVEVMKLVGRVALTNLPVLITGESGTGKEIVARAIHRRSPRASKPFVGVNCGALPAELIESELFGHLRGSFTGAERDRPGLWEEADGGTIFLDEITETAPAVQVKLLRALQEGEIRRVGSNRTQKVDVRVIAASNQNIEAEVKEERFRQDLLYRLNAVSIHLPPLRERREDIRLLAERFAERAREPGDTGIVFSPEAMELLEKYSWPGNIRELENAVDRAAALCDHVVQPVDLPRHIVKSFDAAATVVEGAAHEFSVTQEDELPTLDKWEKKLVVRVLAHTKGNKQAAARILDVDRKTIERMIKRHNIDLS